jgi:signal transduction histidine kinase
MRTDLRRNNITVRPELAENLQLVRCDRVRMQQVILNLIVNAIEAMVAVVIRPKLLAISRAIVEAHGGRIGAVPNEASGATFRFRLPFNGAPAE